jgi:hypothetical protein
MRTSLARVALAGAALFTGFPAAACGFCIEDRVATVYDQGVVTDALARRRVVAFFSLEGEPRADAATQRAVLAALEAAGGVRGTGRVDLASGACSIAFDPARTRLSALVASADRRLAARHIALKAVRVTGPGGALEEVD